MLKFSQIIYIDFEGRTIGTIFEHDNGYWSVNWEADEDETNLIGHTNLDEAKQYVLENFKEHL